MSLESLRQDAILQKTSQITRSQSSHSGRLRSLFYVTRLVAPSLSGVASPLHLPKSLLPPFSFTSPTSPDEQSFLDENSLAKGRKFRDESLPVPVPLPTASLSQPRSTSNAQPSGASHVVSPPSPAADSNSKSHVVDSVKAHPAVELKDGAASLLQSVTVTDTPPRSPNVLPTPDSQLHDAPNGITAACSSNSAPSSEGPSVHEDESTSACPSPPDERLRIDSAISNPPDDEDENFEKPALKPSIPGLPEKERYEGSTNTIASQSVDVVSSPSSTTGAYSTSTPKPIHHSPDTSPEADSSRSAEDLARVVEDRRHRASDDILMKDSASGGALVNGTSPNYQLRLEEAQANVAATRPVDHDGSNGDASLATSLKTPGEDQPLKHMSDLDNSGTKCKETPSKPIAVPNGDASYAISHATPATNAPPSAMFKDVEMLDASHLKMRQANPPTSLEEAQTVPSSTPTRMTTRVASGALRQKSVSEILGGVPKTSPVLNISPAMRRHSGLTNDQESSEKHHRRRSTVVFSKDKDPASAKAYASDLDGYLALKGASLDPEKDYLRPLFLHQAWAPPRSRTLSDLISTASKTLTTSDICAVSRELVEIKILRRIYQLQNANKWSLRQMAKYRDPNPPPCHQDFLLREMRWMRTDFREERRWKMQLARNLARWCAEYIAAPEDVRRTLRVHTSSPPVNDAAQVIADSFDGLTEDDILETIAPTNPPTNLFSLDYDEIVFPISHTPHGTALLGELPVYDPKSDVRSTEVSLPLPSANSLVPVSKYVTGKLVPKIDSLPRKRSRYDFEQSDEDVGPPHKRTNSSQSSPFLSPARRSSPRTEIPPEDQEVALFNPINKHILDRIRANHAFRPPTEFNMPSPTFYETRLQSQWTWDEDQRLRHCVRKYSYNWSLIAQDLADQTQSSQYMSAPERRTPWECFERWMQLEGLPNDMSRTAYFKTYQSRIEQANLKISQAAANAQAQSGSAQSPTQTHNIKRRTSSQPVKVERRKDVKHIGMVDAIRRVARKRENVLHRAHETAKAAALRKAQAEPASNSQRQMQTPAELSRLKAEREAQYREKQEAMARKMLEQQQAALMQRKQVNGQPHQQPPLSTAQQIRNVGATQAAAAQGQIAQNVTQPRMATNGIPNGAIGTAVMAGMSAQQLQALQQAGRLPTAMNGDMPRLAALQQHRQLAALQQAQLANPGLTAHIAASANGITPNQAQQQLLATLQLQQQQRANLAAMSGVNGVNGSSTPNSNPSSIAAQPSQLAAVAGMASSTMLSLMQQIQRQFPQYTTEQVRQLANERMKRMSQSALAAATGAGMSPASAASALQQQAAAAQQHQHQQHNQQALAAAFAAAQPTMGIPGLLGVGQGGSPTPLYRAMQAQMAAHQQQQQIQGQSQGAVGSPQVARLGSGSPALATVRPDSRGGMAQGMVRSVSGKGGSPVNLR